MKRIPIISVEGNIGSGKTTFLNFFTQQVDNIAVIKEPLDLWQNVDGENVLSLMYINPKKYTFLFQIYALLTNLQQHTKASDVKAKIVERFMGHACFIKNSYKEGNLSTVEYSILTRWTNYLLSCHEPNMTADLIIYLRTTPETAFDRIKKRNRNEELNISFDYIKKLHEIHEQWLMEVVDKNLGPKLIVIDANQDLENLTSAYNHAKNSVINFIDHYSAQCTCNETIYTINTDGSKNLIKLHGVKCERMVNDYEDKIKYESIDAQETEDPVVQEFRHPRGGDFSPTREARSLPPCEGKDTNARC